MPRPPLTRCVRVYTIPHLSFTEVSLAVPLIFKTIEESGISSWIRDSPSFFAYWFIIAFHAVGMGLVVGASIIIALRILGVARDLPLAPLKGLYPIIWTGLWVQIISGTLLLIGYPTKAFTNIDFYIKLLMIALAVVVMRKIRKNVFDDETLSDSAMMLKGRALAVWSLVFWAGAVTAGRFLAYTYNFLKYDYRG